MDPWAQMRKLRHREDGHLPSKRPGWDPGPAARFQGLGYVLTAPPTRCGTRGTPRPETVAAPAPDVVPSGAQSVQFCPVHTLQRARPGVGQEGAGRPASLLAGVLQPSRGRSWKPLALSASVLILALATPRQWVSPMLPALPLLPGRAPRGALAPQPGSGLSLGLGQPALSLLGGPCCSCLLDGSPGL